MTPALLAVLALQVQAPTYSWEASSVLIEKEPWPVSVQIKLPLVERVKVPSWVLTPAAFSLNGRPLARREGESDLVFEPGAELNLNFDLGPAIEHSDAFGAKNFRLSFSEDDSGEMREVTFLAAAEKGIEFMDLPEAQLGDYDVVLRTIQGDIWLQLWADVAPGHVRNFLDLAYSGFYDGSKFHRVVPTYMIQGGSARESRPAPRTLDAEFSSHRHVPGVLSMARLGDDVPGGGPNSATCEFFIMHGVAPTLDGNYTAFGQVVTGSGVVDKVANSGNKSYLPTDLRAHTPPVDQTIFKAIVVRAPKNRPREASSR